MEEDAERILRSYIEGYSLRAIGREIGKSHVYVWEMIKKVNPSIMRPPLWHKFRFNHEYFRDYTPENSYWMGFIDADGHVNTKRGRLELKIHCRDVDRLNAFRKSVSRNFPIYHFRTRPQVGIQMISREIVNDLVQKNIGVKSPNLEPPIGIAEDCVRHFLRGYFEGDGSVSLAIRPNGGLNPIFEIIGSRYLLEWMKAKLIQQANLQSRMSICGREGCYVFKIGSFSSIAKIAHYFYDNVDENLFMARKKAKLEKIASHFA